MKGQYDVIVQNMRVRYKFTLNRNLTILRGDSATGKTTLIDMIAERQRRGDESGIMVSCSKPCIVLTDANWEIILDATHESIVFIDEGDRFVRTESFAAKAQESDNYYVIASRNPLATLPYSVQEIYGIRNKAGNRYQNTKRLYSEFYPLFLADIMHRPNKPDCVIVEDSHAGYEFFAAVCGAYSIACISSKGNANMEAVAAACPYENVLVIADGAAFGPYIEKLLNLSRIKQLSLYFPESFEWLILKSRLIHSGEVTRILKHPSDYIESKDYFSWEQFFTALLTKETKETYLAYNKRKLNPVYLQSNEREAILAVMPLQLGK